MANSSQGSNEGHNQTFTTPAGVVPLTFEAWAAAAGLTGADALPLADPDSDGVVNYMERARKTDPRSPTSSSLPYRADLRIGGQPFFSMNYRVWADVVADGVVYEPQLFIGGVLQIQGYIDEVDPDAEVIPGSTARRTRVPIEPGDLNRPATGKFVRLKVYKP